MREKGGEADADVRNERERTETGCARSRDALAPAQRADAPLTASSPFNVTASALGNISIDMAPTRLS